MAMQRRDGFTLVELAVVIVIIGILASIASLTFMAIQKQSRDSSRSSSVSVIANALEKYYEENGEYPGCEAITSPSADFLDVKADTLKAPRAPSGVTNSIVCRDIEATPSDEDVFAFVGDGSTECETGSACSSWKLQYVNESDDRLVAVQSRRNSESIAVEPSTPGSSIAAPTGLTITASMSGSNAQASAGGGTCETGTTIERQMRYAESATSVAGNWSTYAPGDAISQAANQGWRYTFQQQARCAGADGESSWTTSANASTVRPISTPTKPTVAVNTSGNTTTFTGSEASCPASTDAQYRLKSTSDSSYDSGWSNASTIRSETWNTSAEGYKYSKSYQARCRTAHVDSNWSASGVGAYVRPVSKPINIDWELLYNPASPGIVTVQSSGTCNLGAAFFGSMVPWTGNYTWTSGPRAGAKQWYQKTGYYINDQYDPGVTIQYGEGQIKKYARFKGRGSFTCKNPVTDRQSGAVENTSGELKWSD